MRNLQNAVRVFHQSGQVSEIDNATRTENTHFERLLAQTHENDQLLAVNKSSVVPLGRI